MTPDEVVSLLEENRQRLAELTAGMSATDLQTTPKADDWSVNEILAHLRSCADVWGDCIAVMLAEDYSAIRPTIRAVNPRTWIERTDCRKQKFSASFEVFRK